MADQVDEEIQQKYRRQCCELTVYKQQHSLTVLIKIWMHLEMFRPQSQNSGLGLVVQTLAAILGLNCLALGLVEPVKSILQTPT